MYGRIGYFELPIVAVLVLLGGMLAYQFGYALNIETTRNAVVFLFLAPLLEEYVFRYHLQQWIATRFQSPFSALLASTVLFALCHTPWMGLVAFGLLIPGLVLGLYWLRFRNLWYNVALHSMMNAMLALATVTSQIPWS
jgi:membrane protease YdiL (CAAX protease family)